MDGYERLRNKNVSDLMSDEQKEKFKEIEQRKFENMNQMTETQKVLKQIVKQKEEELIQDIINNPDHYHKGGIDIYEILQMKFSPEYYRGFCLGNILKYTLRHELKGGIQDLEKAEFNLDRLIENYKGIKYIPSHKKENK